MEVIDVGRRCLPRLHNGGDRRRLSMSSSMSPWSDRPEPSTSLGCPSVARRRSRRRLRNVGREPSMGVIDVDPQCPPRSHAGKPTPEQPVPQSPLRGRLTGTRGGWKARTNHSRRNRWRLGWVGSDISRRARRTRRAETGWEYSTGDRRRQRRSTAGVIDVSLSRPSGARQSPGGAADGDCGTLDVSLRGE
jgi:hypothetical protein